MKNIASMLSSDISIDDYLLISGIQHFIFCRRQWALMYIEHQWADNALTVSGDLFHERAHNQNLTEKRGDLIITREMPVISHTLQVTGKCDVVEFHKDERGVNLYGRKGLWLPCPVEYKRGRPKTHDADRMQLCAQAICLEEMLLCPPINTAYIYYGEPNRREEIQLNEKLRNAVRTIFNEMRGYFIRSYTPRVKLSKSCKSCSLFNVCLPDMPQNNRVNDYINKALSGD
jgi:CRISPR-associated exonuclease Cas4